MLSVQSMLNIFVFRIDFVEDSVCVVLVAGREDNDLPFFCHFFQKRDSIGPNRKVYLYWSFVDSHVKGQICLTLTIIETVNEGLIQI